MLYQQLLELTRLWMPMDFAIVRAAQVFHFPINPHEVVARTYPPELKTWINDHFTLPYPVVAIEDNASCIVLAEPPEPGQPIGAKGLGVPRVFIECLRADTVDETPFNDNFDDRLECRELARSVPPGTLSISVGTVEAATGAENGFAVAGSLIRTACFCGGLPQYLFDDELGWPPGIDMQQVTMPALRNAMSAIEEIAHIQRLPKFRGWPQPSEPTVFRVNRDGEISVHHLSASTPTIEVHL